MQVDAEKPIPLFEMTKMQPIPAILIDCARSSGSGSLDVLLAEKYLEANEWGRAVRTIQKALKKSHADTDGKAFWILGHAHLKMEQIKLARAAFDKAAGFARYRARAEYWINTLTKHTEAGGPDWDSGIAERYHAY